jgi:hypothetical protein
MVPRYRSKKRTRRRNNLSRIHKKTRKRTNRGNRKQKTRKYKRGGSIFSGKPGPLRRGFESGLRQSLEPMAALVEERNKKNLAAKDLLVKARQNDHASGRSPPYRTPRTLALKDEVTGFGKSLYDGANRSLQSLKETTKQKRQAVGALKQKQNSRASMDIGKKKTPQYDAAIKEFRNQLAQRTSTARLPSDLQGRAGIPEISPDHVAAEDIIRLRELATEARNKRPARKGNLTAMV